MPSSVTFPPPNPISGVRLGFSRSLPNFIASKIIRERTSAEFPQSIRIRWTFTLAIIRMTTKTSLCGWWILAASTSVNSNIGFSFSRWKEYIPWFSGSNLASWAIAFLFLLDPPPAGPLKIVRIFQGGSSLPWPKSSLVSLSLLWLSFAVNSLR